MFYILQLCVQPWTITCICRLSFIIVWLREARIELWGDQECDLKLSFLIKYQLMCESVPVPWNPTYTVLLAMLWVWCYELCCITITLPSYLLTFQWRSRFKHLVQLCNDFIVVMMYDNMNYVLCCVACGFVYAALIWYYIGLRLILYMVNLHN